MTTKQIETILGEMLIRYPRQEIHPATIRAYAIDLADIPLDDLQAVCQRLWLTEEWWPSVAKIRGTWATLQVPDNAAADLDWVRRRMSRLAAGEQPNPFSAVVREPGPDEYPSAACRETVRLFGWRRLYDTDPNWLAKEWASAYAHARQAVIERRTAMPASLDAGACGVPALKAVS